MQRLVQLLLFAALIALGIWGWRACFPGPEAVIRSRLHKLAATVSFKRTQGMLSRVMNARSMPDFFTPDVVVNLDVRGYESRIINGRDHIEAILLSCAQISSLKVELLDINITLGTDGQNAIANLTGKATLEGQRDFYVQEFNFILRKMNGKWLIYRIETVRTLSWSPPEPAPDSAS